MDIYHPRLFVPTYAEMEMGDWRIKRAEWVLCKGYWSPAMLTPGMTGLLRRRPDGEVETWMSMAPLEIESQELGCLHAAGHVLIMGMGMGWSMAATALNPAVTRVTVVELSPDILAMIDRLKLLEQIPAPARAKIRIVNASAFDYHPDQPVDLLMPDIWQPLMNDDRVEDVRRMVVHCRPRQVYFWGQELEIARHARLWGLPLDWAGVRATVARWDLPLLLPDDVDYPALIARAAENWIGNRWFPAPC